MRWRDNARGLGGRQVGSGVVAKRDTPAVLQNISFIPRFSRPVRLSRVLRYAGHYEAYLATFSSTTNVHGNVILG